MLRLQATETCKKTQYLHPLLKLLLVRSRVIQFKSFSFIIFGRFTQYLFRSFVLTVLCYNHKQVKRVKTKDVNDEVFLSVFFCVPNSFLVYLTVSDTVVHARTSESRYDSSTCSEILNRIYLKQTKQTKKNTATTTNSCTVKTQNLPIFCHVTSILCH